MLRITVLLAFCLLAGGILPEAFAGPPPGPPPPPPPPEPTPPPPPVYPCALVSPELIDLIGPKLPFEPDDGLRAARSLEDGSWPLSHDGKVFKTYVNPEWTGIWALLKFTQLQRGAFIGGVKASVQFRITDRGQCFPTVAAARSLDEGSYLLWMAHAPTLGIKLPPELTAGLNWFMAIIEVEISPDGRIDIRDIAGIIFYPDAMYRSPEEMLKTARSLDDGGILVPLPPETVAAG